MKLRVKLVTAFLLTFLVVGFAFIPAPQSKPDVPGPGAIEFQCDGGPCASSLLEPSNNFVAIANPSTGIAPLSVSFLLVGEAAFPAGGTATWYFGDGSSTTGPSVTHVFVNNGEFTVTVVLIIAGAPTVVDTAELSVKVIIRDTDGDGVPDIFDEFPTGDSVSHIAHKLDVNFPLDGGGYIEIPLLGQVSPTIQGALLFGISGLGFVHYGSNCGGPEVITVMKIEIPNQGLIILPNEVLPTGTVGYPYLIYGVCPSGTSTLLFIHAFSSRSAVSYTVWFVY